MKQNYRTSLGLGYEEAKFDYLNHCLVFFFAVFGGVVQAFYVVFVLVIGLGKGKGKGLGDALGDALGEALGDALGNPLWLVVGQGQGLGLALF